RPEISHAEAPNRETRELSSSLPQCITRVRECGRIMERLPAGSAKPPTRATQRLRMRLESRITMARECRKTTRKLSGGTAEQRTRVTRKLSSISAPCITKGKGVRQDYAEASRWYRRAADQGDAMAQYGLGYTYFQ